MNLAQLLAKPAAAWSDRPAVAVGAGTVLTYRGLADRVSRIATGLRDVPRARARRPGGSGDDQYAGIRGSAVRGVAWRVRGGAGQRQAAPAGVRLHPGRLRGAGLHRDRRPRGGNRRRRRRSSRAPRRRGGRRARLCKAPRRGTPFDGRSGARRPRLAVLHQRHDGTPEGRDAQPPQPANHDAQLLRRCRPGGRGQHHRPRRADVARLRHVPAAAHRQGRVPGDPREQRASTATSSSLSSPSTATSRRSSRPPW